MHFSILTIFLLSVGSCQTKQPVKPTPSEPESVEQKANDYSAGPPPVETLQLVAKKPRAYSYPRRDNLNLIAVVAEGSAPEFEVAVCTLDGSSCDPSKEQPAAFVKGIEGLPTSLAGELRVITRGCKDINGDPSKRTCSDWGPPQMVAHGASASDEVTKEKSTYRQTDTLKTLCQEKNAILRTYLNEHPEQRDTEAGKNIIRQLDQFPTEACIDFMLSDLPDEMEKKYAEKSAEGKMGLAQSNTQTAYAWVVLTLGTVGFITGFAMLIEGHFEAKRFDAAYNARLGEVGQNLLRHQEYSRAKADFDSFISQHRTAIASTLVEVDASLQKLGNTALSDKLVGWIEELKSLKLQMPQAANGHQVYEEIVQYRNRIDAIMSDIAEYGKASRNLRGWFGGGTRWNSPGAYGIDVDAYNHLANLRAHVEALRSKWSSQGKTIVHDKIFNPPPEFQRAIAYVEASSNKKLIDDFQARNIPERVAVESGSFNWSRAKKWAGLAIMFMSAAFISSNLGTLADLNLAESGLEPKLADVYSRMKAARDKVLANN